MYGIFVGQDMLMYGRLDILLLVILDILLDIILLIRLLDGSQDEIRLILMRWVYTN